MAPTVILYSYPESPFGQKLTLVLLFKRIPFTVCTVPRIPPRDALLALGITYRRIPVLAIGNDVFLDTSLATAALEATFPEYPLSGGKSWGLQTGASFFWADRSIFKIAAALLDWSKMSRDFLEDRTQYMGGPPINPEALVKARPNFLSAMRSHMAVIETQLHSRASPSHFILDSPSPTYLDLSLFFTLNWVSKFGTADALFDSSQFPLVMQWMALLRSAITKQKELAPKAAQISDEEAMRTVYGGANVAVVVDEKEPVLKSVGLGGSLALGEKVAITPDDTGKVAQQGTLVGINAERVVVEVTTKDGKCRVHAPRLGFSVRAIA